MHGNARCAFVNTEEKGDQMAKSLQDDQWVWVVVQDPGGKEQFLGQRDGETGESLIPAFLEKEEAQQGLNLLPREEGHAYEVQAIRFDDLCRRAAENGFNVLVLTGTGEVLEKVATRT